MKLIQEWASVVYWDIYITLKEPRLAFWVFIGPILFMLFFGFILSGSDYEGANTIPVQIRHISKSDPLYTQLIKAGFKPDPKSKIILDFDAKSPLHVKVSIRNQTEKWSIQTKLFHAYLNYLVPKSKRINRVRVVSRPWTQRFAFPSGFAYAIPSNMVMYIFFNLYGLFMFDWVEERRSKFFTRILSSPRRYGLHFLGKLSARFIIGLYFILISLFVGAIFHVEWGQDIGLVGLILILYIVGTIALGYLVSMFFSDPESASAIGVVTSLVVAALGGCWWPLEVVSPTMQKIGLMLPTGQMMNTFMKSYLYPHPNLHPNLNYMFGFCTVLVLTTLVVARRHFRMIQHEA